MHAADASAHEPQLEQFSLLTVSSSASTPKPRPQSRGFFLALACSLGAQRQSGLRPLRVRFGSRGHVGAMSGSAENGQHDRAARIKRV
jgi:hypothetical protein